MNIKKPLWLVVEYVAFKNPPPAPHTRKTTEKTIAEYFSPSHWETEVYLWWCRQQQDKQTRWQTLILKCVVWQMCDFDVNNTCWQFYCGQRKEKNKTKQNSQLTKTIRNFVEEGKPLMWGRKKPQDLCDECFHLINVMLTASSAPLADVTKYQHWDRKQWQRLHGQKLVFKNQGKNRGFHSS